MAGIPTDLLELRQLQAPRASLDAHRSRLHPPGARAQPRTKQQRRTCCLSPKSSAARATPLEAAPTRGYPVSTAGAERFGEWLVRRRCIGRSELFSALDVSYRHGCRLGDALVWLEFLDRQAVEREARFFRRLACSTAARVVPPAE